MKIQFSSLNVIKTPKIENSFKSVAEKFTQVKNVAASSFNHLNREFVVDYVKQNKVLFSATAISSLFGAHSIYSLMQNKEIIPLDYCEEKNENINPFSPLETDNHILAEPYYFYGETFALVTFLALSAGVGIFHCLQQKKGNQSHTRLAGMQDHWHPLWYEDTDKFSSHITSSPIWSDEYERANIDELPFGNLSENFTELDFDQENVLRIAYLKEQLTKLKDGLDGYLTPHLLPENERNVEIFDELIKQEFDEDLSSFSKWEQRALSLICSRYKIDKFLYSQVAIPEVVENYRSAVLKAKVLPVSDSGHTLQSSQHSSNKQPGVRHSNQNSSYLDTLDRSVNVSSQPWTEANADCSDEEGGQEKVTSQNEPAQVGDFLAKSRVYWDD